MMGGDNNYYITLESRNIKELNDIIAMANSYKTTVRKGKGSPCLVM